MAGGARLAELVRNARDGDESAWGAIVDRFEGLVWATTRAHRLPQAAAADVTQTTWLRLVENLDRIKDPERLGAWLATTARRECLRHIRLRGRELQVEDESIFEASTEESLDRRIIDRERYDALWQAFARLGERCQALLRLLSVPDPPSYEEIGAALEMPIGAIGPTRSRCLEKLRGSPELAGINSVREDE
jgi:RNA polymerase sigma factor (sigma-70 family)